MNQILSEINDSINEMRKSFTKSSIKQVTKILKNVGIYTVPLSNYVYGTKEYLCEVFKRIPRYENTSKLFTKEKTTTSDLQDISGTFDFTFYEGTLIVCSFETIKYGINSLNFTLKLSTIRRKKDMKNLDKFISNMFEEIRKAKYENSRNSYYIHDSEIWAPVEVNKPLRTFDDVFVPEYLKREIRYSLSKFIKNKKWYAEKNIPYHFGILLHGEPGGGKTSLAQAITAYVNGICYILDGDDLEEIIKWKRYFKNQYERDVCIVEDIDCGFFKDKTVSSRKDKSTDQKSSNVGLSTILNIIDGASAPENMIYIFTTNHIEKLDPALIRPGRIDLCIEIKPVDLETFKQFVKYHYKTTDIPDITIKPGLSFATLQVMVMKGCSLEELIDFVEV